MILTDKQIEAIDIHCGMTEIDGSEPFSTYKYEHHLLKAQLKKVYELGNGECTEHHAAYTPKHQCVQCMSSIWQALLEEIEPKSINRGSFAKYVEEDKEPFLE